MQVDVNFTKSVTKPTCADNLLSFSICFYNLFGAMYAQIERKTLHNQTYRDMKITLRLISRFVALPISISIIKLSKYDKLATIKEYKNDYTSGSVSAGTSCRGIG